VGTSGTYVVAHQQPADLELIEDVALSGSGWHRYFVREPLLPDRRQLSNPSESVPIAIANVLDSDYCHVIGIVHGKVAWTWDFGEPPWNAAPFDAESADNPRTTRAAENVSTQIANWAARCGLSSPDTRIVTAVLDRGYVFAEEGLFGLLDALGLSPVQPPVAEVLAPRPRDHVIRVFTSTHRWLLLQVNTPTDLYQHLAAVADWLNMCRQSLVVPLMASYEPEQVRTAIDPHEPLAGPPGGLLVRSAGWSTKNRPVFGAGDDRGWNRKLQQLSRRELREITLTATALNSAGKWYEGPGELELRAVMRDQFSQGSSAPLPPEHPGQLYLRVRAGLLDRIPDLDLDAVLKALGDQAVRTIPDCSGFVEIARPQVASIEHLTPASPPSWCSPIGAYHFRPEWVVEFDPHRRTG
jgi:hypothetical protein